MIYFVSYYLPSMIWITDLNSVVGPNTDTGVGGSKIYPISFEIPSL